MITDSFRGDLQYIQTMLEEKVPFSISRFGDGEMMILNNQNLNLLNKGEFNFQGQDHLRKDLENSFTHNQDNYYVGIACPCCVGEDKSYSMKKATSLPENKLTWANILVNSNYPYFRDAIVPRFVEYTVTVVAPGDIDGLPFKVDHRYSIGPDAWVHNADVYDQLVNQLNKEKDDHHLVVLCAGPFANILCHKLFSRFPSNTIIDAGSVFNIELGIGANRGYLNGADTLHKVCRW